MTTVPVTVAIPERSTVCFARQRSEMRCFCHHLPSSVQRAWRACAYRCNGEQLTDAIRDRSFEGIGLSPHRETPTVRISIERGNNFRVQCVGPV